jgi:hypothetical protein
VAHGYWEQKGLTSALTEQGPYEFAVSGAGDDYIDLANTYLFLEAHIVDDVDAALDGGADVGPVNLWMHSLVLHIRQCLIPFLKPRVFTPFFNKGMAALKSPPKILLSPCPL